MQDMLHAYGEYYKSYLRQVSTPYGTTFHSYHELPTIPCASIDTEGANFCCISLQDDKHIAVGFPNKSIDIFNIHTLSKYLTIPTKYSNVLNLGAISRDYLAAAGWYSSVIEIYNWRTGQHVLDIPVETSYLCTGRRNMITFNKYMIVRTQANQVIIFEFTFKNNALVAYQTLKQLHILHTNEDSMEVFANGCIICTVGTAIQVFDLNTGDIVKTVKGSYETPWTSALVSENMVSFACPVSQQENSQQTFIIDVIKDTNIIVSSEAVDVRSTVSLGYGLVAFAASDVFVYDMNLNQVVCRWDLPLVQDLVFLPSGYLICCDLHDTIRIFKLKNCLTYEESFGSRMKKCQEYVDIKFK